MKSIRSRITVGLFAIASAFTGATVARADLAYLIDINTTSLLGNSSAPFSIDFQSLYGSGAAQTITVSNFSLTGGTLLGGANSFGAVSGLLPSTLTFNPSAGSFYNEYFQQFSSTVTDIKFRVDLSTNASVDTPTSFVVALLDNNFANIPTSGVGDSLVIYNLNGANTNFQTGTGLGVAVSVTPVPEPATYGLVASAAALALVALRRRRAVKA